MNLVLFAIQVRALMISLPQKERWLFTNCNEKHANIALELLNLKVCPVCRYNISPGCGVILKSNPRHVAYCSVQATSNSALVRNSL